MLPRVAQWLPPDVSIARLVQSVERKALNLVVVGSSPTVGVFANPHCRRYASIVARLPIDFVAGFVSTLVARL